MERRSLSRLFRLATLVVILVLAFVYRSQIQQAFSNIRGLNPLVLLVLPLYTLWNWIASFAWLALHRVLTAGSAPSAWRLSLIRLQAQAANLVLPLASVGGEVVRATILSRRTGQVAGTTSAVILDKLTDITAGAVFAVFGALIGLGELESNTTAMAVLTAIFLIGLAGLPLALRLIAKRVSQAKSSVATALAPMCETPAEVSKAFYQAVAWHLGERILTATEIYVAMWAAGIDVSLLNAVFVAALMTGYSLVFFFVPGQVGAIEAGIVSAFATLGLPADAALTVALVRRARQLVLVGLGTLLFLLGGRSKRTQAEVKRCD